MKSLPAPGRLCALIFGLSAGAAALFGCGSTAAKLTASEELVEVEVKTVHLLGGTSPVVVLGPQDSSRLLPIWIGVGEAQAIARTLEEQEIVRPMTHDLAGDIITRLDARLERTVVTHIQDDTFYAKLVLRRGDQRFEIDSRPSDAIAIALRLEAPIFVSRSVLDTVSVDMTEETPGATRIGFKVQAMTPPLATFFQLDSPRGLLVREVHMDTPASRAGLRVGDVILTIDQTAVDDPRAFAELAGPDEQHQLMILRDGDPLELSIEAPRLEEE